MMAIYGYIWQMTMMGRQDTDTGKEVLPGAIAIWKAPDIIDEPSRKSFAAFRNSIVATL